MTDVGARAPDAPAVESGVYPTDLMERAQWLTWKPTEDGRKVPRAPYEYQDQPDRFVSAQEPDNWTTFEEAQAWADRLPGHDLAFTIPTGETDENSDDGGDEHDPHVLIDYDDARNPETGAVHPIVSPSRARELVRRRLHQRDGRPYHLSRASTRGRKSDRRSAARR